MDNPKQPMERMQSCVTSDQSINNRGKRKRDMEEDESRQRKKRKLNENELNLIEDRVRELFAKNVSLIKESNLYKRERDQFEKERNYYKKQMEQYKPYKYKYINLKKQIVSFTDNDNKEKEEEEEENINKIQPNAKNNKNNSSKECMRYNKVNIVNIKRKKSLFSTKSNTTNIDEISNKRNSKRHQQRKSIFSSTNNKHKAYQKSETDESIDDDDSVYVPSDNDELEKGNNYKWEDCHFVAVDCKICGKKFKDFNEYAVDLQYHFDSDPSKIWLKCNESGCDPSKIFNKHTFISHLHRHGYPNPFHCKMVLMDGNTCNHSTSLKGNMVLHLAAKKHNIKLSKTSKKNKYNKYKRKKDAKRTKK